LNLIIIICNTFCSINPMKQFEEAELRITTYSYHYIASEADCHKAVTVRFLPSSPYTIDGYNKTSNAHYSVNQKLDHRDNSDERISMSNPPFRKVLCLSIAIERRCSHAGTSFKGGMKRGFTSPFVLPVVSLSSIKLSKCTILCQPEVWPQRRLELSCLHRQTSLQDKIMSF
jgi:hypothetical protein